jgi:hypothetical protein
LATAVQRFALFGDPAAGQLAMALVRSFALGKERN